MIDGNVGDPAARDAQLLPDAFGTGPFAPAQLVPISRLGIRDDDDLWRAEPNGDGTYQAPERVAELATTFDENDAWISSDGRTIYFTSTRGGDGLDIYMATR